MRQDREHLSLVLFRARQLIKISMTTVLHDTGPSYILATAEFTFTTCTSTYLLPT